MKKQMQKSSTPDKNQKMMKVTKSVKCSNDENSNSPEKSSTVPMRRALRPRQLSEINRNITSVMPRGTKANIPRKVTDKMSYEHSMNKVGIIPSEEVVKSKRVSRLRLDNKSENITNKLKQLDADLRNSLEAPVNSQKRNLRTRQRQNALGKENTTKESEMRKAKAKNKSTCCVNKMKEPLKVGSKNFQSNSEAKGSKINLNSKEVAPQQLDIYDFESHDVAIPKNKCVKMKSKLPQKANPSQRKKTKTAVKDKEICPKISNIKEPSEIKLKNSTVLNKTQLSSTSSEHVLPLTPAKVNVASSNAIICNIEQEKSSVYGTPYCSISNKDSVLKENQSISTFETSNNFVTSTPAKKVPEATIPPPATLYYSTSESFSDNSSPKCTEPVDCYALFVDLPKPKEKRLPLVDDTFEVKKPKHDYSIVKAPQRKLKKPTKKVTKETRETEEMFQDWAAHMNSHFNEIDLSDLIIE